jgi:hypothetical protein
MPPAGFRDEVGCYGSNASELVVGGGRVNESICECLLLRHISTLRDGEDWV